MKYKKHLIQQPLLVAGLLFLFSCSEGDKAETTQNKPAVPGLAAGKPSGPFAFYKDVSVRPGLNFEVLSWGKGADSVGGYLVLMSDSVKKNYKSLSNEREGIITDAWNMDLDNDGNPEVYIEFMIEKNRSDLHVYEYAGGGFNKITFPGLSTTMKKIYEGNDKFTIKEGDLFRSFPVTGTEDGEKAGGTKTLQYKLSGNSFSVSEVKE